MTGSHAAYQTINSLIRKLDLRRSQVFVEIRDVLDIGVNGGFQFGTSIFAGQAARPQDTAIATDVQAGGATPVGPLVAAEAANNIPGTTQ